MADSQMYITYHPYEDYIQQPYRYCVVVVTVMEMVYKTVHMPIKLLKRTNTLKLAYQ